jgi:capsule polysaccharide export protein KpsE/RkpR
MIAYRVVIAPVIAALLATTCTASHYRQIIRVNDLKWANEVAQAQADAAMQIVQQQQITAEVENAYQEKLTDLRTDYATATARLRNAEAKARSLRTVSDTTTVSDVAATNAVSDGASGEHYTVDAIGFESLLYDADVTTRQLTALQAWVSAQLDSSRPTKP